MIWILNITIWIWAHNLLWHCSDLATVTIFCSSVTFIMQNSSHPYYIVEFIVILNMTWIKQNLYSNTIKTNFLDFNQSNFNSIQRDFSFSLFSRNNDLTSTYVCLSVCLSVTDQHELYLSLAISCYLLSVSNFLQLSLAISTGYPKKNCPLAHFWVFDFGRGVFSGKK